VRDSGPQVIDLGISGISDAIEIGSGGFGIVYRAVEADLGRTVAVKVLTGRLDEASRLRFERERRAMGTLSGHPNIVTIYRGGYTPEGKAYLIMEYLARGSLADRLQMTGPLPWTEALKYGIQLSGALETSHRAGVLHRDIKPGNILLSGLGNAKLADFGIARLHGAPETQSSVVTASIAHAPPEIINGHRPNEVADVYSLASTMFELLSGSPPFVRPTDESLVPILARIHQDPLPTLNPVVIPGPMAAALEAATAKERGDRPPSALDFGNLLADTQRQLGQSPTAVPFASSSDPRFERAGPSATIPPFPLTPSTPLPPPVPPVTGPTPGDDDVTSVPNGRTVASTGVSGDVAPPVNPSQVDATQVSPGTGPRPLPPDHNVTGQHHRAQPGPGPDPAAPPGPQYPEPDPDDPAANAHVRKTGWRPLIQQLTTKPIIAISATAIVAVVAIAIVAMALSNNDNGGDIDASAETDPSAGSTPSETPSSGPASPNTTFAEQTTTSLSDANDDYPVYVNINDPTGQIRLHVPEGWGDVDYADSDGYLSLRAAPQLNKDNIGPGFIDSHAVPGVTVTVRRLDDGYDPVDTLNKLAQDESDCTPGEPKEISTPIEGWAAALVDCGAAQSGLAHYVFIPEFSNSVFAVMRIQIVTNQDHVAASTIANSMSIRTN